MEMLGDVTKRLASFGYTVTDADGWVLGFIIGKVENHIKNDCNIQTIPDGLHQIAVDMVVGEFLLGKKATDSDSLTGLDLDAAVKQIQEGDTSVTFAIGEGSSTPEQRLDSLIGYLMNYGHGQFTTYRCMTW